MNTGQLQHWRGEFGRAYTDRNSLTPTALDALYRKNFGVARSELNRRFLADIPRESRILEVGCNEGNQLSALREIGFAQLYGIEVQEYALRRACNRLKTAQFVLATAFEIPFPDGFFDVIFTSGVLIHIAPPDLPKALHEIHRCAGRIHMGTRVLFAAADGSHLPGSSVAAVESGLCQSLSQSLRRPRSRLRGADTLP